jgi:phosphoglycolate phosphatase-like HAD superfamily hydrolase
MVDTQPQHKFLVGMDSDGCAFDTMELKQKECFIPLLIDHFGLQGVSRYAREAAEFVNLYSTSRGVNRFPALVESLDWLRRRPEVRNRQVAVPELPELRRWIASERRLGNPTLAEIVKTTGNIELAQVLAWSEEVNRTIARVVHGVPPFPGVRRCLEMLVDKADVLVVSATPYEALRSEWQEHDLVGFVRAICGQEQGTKKEMLRAAARYPAGQSLMIGDAPGDYQAADANDCRFFPINPGAEEASWARLVDEGLERFLSRAFSPDYQQSLLEEFNARLPSRPPWPVLELEPTHR